MRWRKDEAAITKRNEKDEVGGSLLTHTTVLTIQHVMRKKQFRKKKIMNEGSIFFFSSSKTYHNEILTLFAVIK